MIKQLVEYVKWYINPSDEDLETFFVNKMENFQAIYIKQILDSYTSLLKEQIPTEFNRDHIMWAQSIHTPEELIIESKEYAPQFLNIESHIMLYSIQMPTLIKEHLQNNVKDLAATMTNTLEYIMVQLTELYFLSDKNIIDFWNEVSKDKTLKELCTKLEIYPLINDRKLHSLFPKYEGVSKHSLTIIISYVIALINILSK
jgi:hypothetical protein